MFELIDFLIVNPITNILYAIYNFVGDFGLAIILFTILVKLCMWPLMRRQLHQTRLMRKIQPELDQIKKNCKGNRQLESLQTMDLYKRYNVKPFRSILTIFIQLPIFIALYTAIRVMVMPTPSDNLMKRAYDFNKFGQVAEVVEKQETYLADTQNNTYDFHPKLFGLIELDKGVGFGSISEVAILLFAITAAFVQYLYTKQQMPSGKNEKKKGFRQLVKEAADGKEVDQSEMNMMMTGQMSKIMPIMMLLIMINLPGALVFYYLLSNVFNFAQQKIIFLTTASEMEAATDKSLIRKLNKIQEAEIIENKKTGTKIKRISAKEIKKRRK